MAIPAVESKFCYVLGRVEEVRHIGFPIKNKERFGRIRSKARKMVKYLFC